MAPPDEFFVGCSMGSYPMPCPEVELYMGTVGICYTMMNTPETSMIVNITGHQAAISYELDIAQWDYTSQAATKGAGVAVSEAVDVRSS